MKKYILVRGAETVEVLEGREERRDRLMAAGYEWVNADEFADARSSAELAPEADLSPSPSSKEDLHGADHTDPG